MIFKDIGEGPQSVLLDWFGNDSAWAIADGYKEAGDAVVNYTCSTSQHPDRFFWPVAFLYRHALELIFKELIRKGSVALQEPPHKRNLKGHNLKRLWSTTRSMLMNIWPDGDQADLRCVDEFVTDIHKIDPGGDAFRYRANIKGDVHLSQLPRRLSLQHLADEFEEVYSLLDGALTGIRELPVSGSD